MKTIVRFHFLIHSKPSMLSVFGMIWFGWSSNRWLLKCWTGYVNISVEHYHFNKCLQVYKIRFGILHQLCSEWKKDHFVIWKILYLSSIAGMTVIIVSTNPSFWVKPLCSKRRVFDMVLLLLELWMHQLLIPIWYQYTGAF